MGRSAAEIEREINEALEGTSLSAFGLWIRMNLRVTSNLDSLTIDDENPLAPEHVALGIGVIVGMVGPRPKEGKPDKRESRARHLLEKLADIALTKVPGYERVGLIKVLPGDLLFSPATLYLQSQLRSDRIRKKGGRNSSQLSRNSGGSGGIPANSGGIPAEGSNPQESPENTVVQDGIPATPPPKVSLSHTLSLPNPPPIHTSTRAREAEPAESTDQQFQAALAAFEHWSRFSRGHGFSGLNGEERAVQLLLHAVAQETPIIQGDRQTPRGMLIPLAVELLRKDGTDFKQIAYACKCVRGRLEDWALKGMPGGKPIPQRQQAVKKSKTYDF